jgi:hypothetical protein
VLFEPRAGAPLSAQPVVADLFSWPRKQFVNPWRWLFTIAGVAVLAWPGQPLGIAIPTIVAAGGLAGLIASATRLIPKADFAALNESPVRQVDLTDLRQAGRRVAFPLDEHWVVARLPAADVLLLARLRRIWVFGPSPGGRLGLMVPGGTTPKAVRLVTAPPPGAVPVPPTPEHEWPVPPKDDPAVQQALATRLRAIGYSMVVVVLMLGLLAVDLLADRPESLAANAMWSIPVVLLLLIVLVTVGDINRTRRARRSTRWAWTRVTVVEAPKVVSPYRMRLKVRVTAPQGDVHLEVSGPASIVLAVQESGKLWLIGELHATRPMIAGIPEVPLVGRTRGTRGPA